MASKYAFGSGLKELRFLFCQTSEHSAPVRYATPRPERMLRCAWEQHVWRCVEHSWLTLFV